MRGGGTARAPDYGASGSAGAGCGGALAAAPGAASASSASFRIRQIERQKPLSKRTAMVTP